MFCFLKRGSCPQRLSDASRVQLFPIPVPSHYRFTNLCIAEAFFQHLCRAD